MSNTDRIEKKVVLRATRSRVWRAITDAEEFGAWFRAKLEGPFVEGATVRGKITHPGYEHLTIEILVERIEPERYFAYRWHPYAIDPAVDYSAEPMTLVEFGWIKRTAAHCSRLSSQASIASRSRAAARRSG